MDFSKRDDDFVIVNPGSFSATMPETKRAGIKDSVPRGKVLASGWNVICLKSEGMLMLGLQTNNNFSGENYWLPKSDLS